MTAPHDSIRIVVRGTPGPQGSKSVNAAGAMYESSKKVQPWRRDVKAAAYLARRSTVERDDGTEISWLPPLDGPLVASMVFTVTKPASAPKRRRTWPDRTPDLSKLVRSTEDALTDAGVWTDDARVVQYAVLAKVFPGEVGSPWTLEVPGVVIEVSTLDAWVLGPSGRALHPPLFWGHAPDGGWPA